MNAPKICKCKLKSMMPYVYLASYSITSKVNRNFNYIILIIIFLIIILIEYIKGVWKFFAIPNLREKDCGKWQHKNTIYIVVSISRDIMIFYGENLLSPNLIVCATSKTYGTLLLFDVLLDEKHSHEKEWKEDKFNSVYLWPRTGV